MMTTATLGIRAAEGTWVLRAGGAVLAETERALELFEGDRAPVIYFPMDDVGMAFLEPSATRTVCPLKGEAHHFDLVTRHGRIRDAAWTYPDPLPDAGRIAGHVAFHVEAGTIEQL